MVANCAGARIGRSSLTTSKLVAGDEIRAAADGEGEEVVVVGVAGDDRRSAFRIVGEARVVARPVGERGGFLRRDPLAPLRIGDRSLELDEQHLGDHELE